MKKLVVGILAHVDAGKTTLSEALLYSTGEVRRLGRVDNKDAFLDNYELERKRGITIFSKQAEIKTPSAEITLLDTPGHVDFSSEAERTLQVLDYAVLVISGRDGVQVHTKTLWKLLCRYEVPAFIFVNKMDLDGTNKHEILNNLRTELSEGCTDFSAENDEFFENVALSDEVAMEEYMESGSVSAEKITKVISERKIFPCFFGSALRLFGIDEFIAGIEKYTVEKEYPEEFSARVYKISRDNQGNRMTHIKVIGGSLKARSVVVYKDKNGEEITDEKANMLRIYSGNKFDSVDEIKAGNVCAVLGLTRTYPGQGIGKTENCFEPILEPVMSYRLILPAEISPVELLPKLRQLEEEDPQLHIGWNETGREISISLMGEIQTEIFRSLVEERFGVSVSFDEGNIIYKETIAEAVEGIGHFEPLRHYAEVHLLLEPGDPGTGIVIETKCKEDLLDRNWQRLIVTHLFEKTHRGVLIGAPITDMKITLIAGRAHVKHTEGGDFRQATYRALRQGLMKAKSILLEPWYSFKLEVPSEQIGRAINDIHAMCGTISQPETVGDMVLISGRAPVSEMCSYMKDVLAYTKGKGRLFCLPEGYAPCHNAEKIIEAVGYNPEADIENTPDSVFCSHGAGTLVKWNEVEKYMHITCGLNFGIESGIPSLMDVKLLRRNLNIDEKELEAIMDREFGPIRRRQYSETTAELPEFTAKPSIQKKDYYIVDGYNVIFAWEGLANFAYENLDFARHTLMDILANFCGYVKCELVLVFDGYKVKDNLGEKSDYHGIHVVYTKENETGDMYIEKLAEEIGKNYAVKVVSSDNLIQVATLRSGMLRMSSDEFKKEIEWTGRQINEIIQKNCKSKFYRPFENLQ